MFKLLKFPALVVCFIIMAAYRMLFAWKTRIPWQRSTGIFHFVRTLSKIAFDKMGMGRSYIQQECVNARGEPLPCYTYPLIEYLENFDFSGKKCFEFGSGNSTLFWGKRCKSVTSAELSEEWCEKIRRMVSANSQIILCKNPDQYAMTIYQEKQIYDIVVVDSQMRDLCAREALKVIADDGIIILDDSERCHDNPEYINALQLLQQDGRFLQVDFYGFSPIVDFTKITTLFISRKFSCRLRSNCQPVPGIGNRFI